MRVRFCFSVQPITGQKTTPGTRVRAFGFCVLLVSLLAEAGDQAGEE